MRKDIWWTSENELDKKDWYAFLIFCWANTPTNIPIKCTQKKEENESDPTLGFSEKTDSNMDSAILPKQIVSVRYFLLIQQLTPFLGMIN